MTKIDSAIEILLKLLEEPFTVSEHTEDTINQAIGLIKTAQKEKQAMRSDMNYARQKIEEGLKAWFDGDVPEGWEQLVMPIRQAYEILGE